jgi:hypothetical protein
VLFQPAVPRVGTRTPLATNSLRGRFAGASMAGYGSVQVHWEKNVSGGKGDALPSQKGVVVEPE